MVKNPPAVQRDLGSIPGSGKSPGEGNDYPLHYSCLKNSMDRAAWQTIVHGVTKKSDMSELLSNNNNMKVSDQRRV